MPQNVSQFLVFLIISFFCFSLTLFSQEVLPLSNEVPDQYWKKNSAFHSSVKPYLLSDFDSAENSNGTKNYKNFFLRKLFTENLIELKDSNYSINVNLLPNFTIGNDKNGTCWLNSRGVQFSGNVLENIYFYSDLHEIQAVFPEYVDEIITEENIIPGQTFPRIHENVQDIYYGSGFVSYSLVSILNLQFGHGKNFIGDGYRSMLLSDASAAYPYLKLTTTLGNVRYMFLLSFLMRKSDPIKYERKYSVSHYFDWNISKHITVGFFESVIWKAQDSTGYRGFDINYLNPVVVLRPVEYSLGSPDNALLGLNISIKPLEKLMLYGQFVLDEATNDLYSGNGSVNNKSGFQVGLKGYDLFSVKNLTFQTEINSARPYTYSHFDTVKNYAHYNQPLAHPMGANFFESVNILSYSIINFYLKAQVNYAYYGKDESGSNYGKNIFRSYKNNVKQNGNYIGQGVRTNFNYYEFSISYLLNPNYNLRVETGIINKHENSNLKSFESTYYYIGLRSSFRNLYYDF